MSKTINDIAASAYLITAAHHYESMFIFSPQKNLLSYRQKNQRQKRKMWRQSPYLRNKKGGK